MTSTAQLRPLLLASAKMFYRSLDTVWFAAVSPLLIIAISALVRHLHFAFAHNAGSISFFSFTAIGWAAFLAAHMNQDGIVGTASGYRAQGALKRIAVTPISPRVFIAAQVLTRLAVGLAQTILVLAIVIALGANIADTADLAWLLPLAAIALLTGTAFGFAIAGATDNPEAANQINITLSTPVLLLGGILYPLQGLPGVLPRLAEYVVPFAAPVQAFREAAAGHLTGDFPRLLLISLAWLAVAIALAIRNYRLIERDP
jgi:ABC-type multidrug transport system permease subunit